mmetsp:Transcript_18636/g.31876  ORF Transcript_18636/g.31876 Transcript_18636/m.31876 type:complete len:186 (+) Transcript_18636:915-1472(+)
MKLSQQNAMGDLSNKDPSSRNFQFLSSLLKMGGPPPQKVQSRMVASPLNHSNFKFSKPLETINGQGKQGSTIPSMVQSYRQNSQQKFSPDLQQKQINQMKQQISNQEQELHKLLMLEQTQLQMQAISSLLHPSASPQGQQNKLQPIKLNDKSTASPSPFLIGNQFVSNGPYFNGNTTNNFNMLMG